MSTRSWIGIKQKDQSLNLVYCHYDGYIEHNGLLLQNYYQTIDKIKQLIKNGSIRILKETVESTDYFIDENDIIQYKSIDDLKQDMITNKNFIVIEYFYYFDEEVNTWFVGEIDYDSDFNAKQAIFKPLKDVINTLNLSE